MWRAVWTPSTVSSGIDRGPRGQRRAEPEVARFLRSAGQHQIAQAGQPRERFALGTARGGDPGDFGEASRDDRRARGIAQTRADGCPRRDGHDVLERAAQFRTDDIGRAVKPQSGSTARPATFAPASYRPRRPVSAPWADPPRYPPRNSGRSAARPSRGRVAPDQKPWARGPWPGPCPWRRIQGSARGRRRFQHGAERLRGHGDQRDIGVDLGSGVTQDRIGQTHVGQSGHLSRRGNPRRPAAPTASPQTRRRIGSASAARRHRHRRRKPCHALAPFLPDPTKGVAARIKRPARARPRLMSLSRPPRSDRRPAKAIIAALSVHSASGGARRPSPAPPPCLQPRAAWRLPRHRPRPQAR
jgi:hypothetical protein